MRDGLVDTGALSSRNSAVVDDVDAAPTAIAGSSNAALAVRVDLARIIDDLTLGFKRDLARNELEDLSGVPLADLRIGTLHEHKHFSTLGRCHSIIEGCRSRATESSNCISENGNLGSLIHSSKSLVNSRRSSNPQLIGNGGYLSRNPDGSRRIVNSGHGGSERSIPLSFNVASANLETTVITNEVGRGVVVLLTARFACFFGCSTVRSRVALQRSCVAAEARRNTLLGTFLHGHTVFCMLTLMIGHITNVSVADTLCFASDRIGTVSRSSFVALVGGLVALVGRRKALFFAFSQGYTFSGSTARYALEVSFVTNVTIAGFVLVVLRTNPLLKSRGRVVRVIGLSGAVGS